MGIDLLEDLSFGGGSDGVADDTDAIEEQRQLTTNLGEEIRRSPGEHPRVPQISTIGEILGGGLEIGFLDKLIEVVNGPSAFSKLLPPSRR